jgi:Phage integrase, N-terminal SAM-like domain
MAAYRSHLRNHILPVFGDVPLAKINRHAVKMFVVQLRRTLADSSVASVMSLLNLLLREAVADQRIGHNPGHGVRVTTRRPAERPTATAAQINTTVDRIGRAPTRSWWSPPRTPACGGVNWPGSLGPTPGWATA